VRALRSPVTRAASGRHAVGLCLLFVAAACSPRLNGQAVEPAKELPAFTVARHDGRPFSTGASGDSLTLLFFGYTHCPDVCPTTLADWKRVRGGLGDDAGHVRFVFISVDPARDTPALAQQYVAQFDSAFVGLAADSVLTRRMVDAYGVGVIPGVAAPALPIAPGPRAGAHQHGDTSQLLGHSSQAFLLDRAGRLIALYAPGTNWTLLLADLQALL